jgi:hypothetical protein
MSVWKTAHYRDEPLQWGLRNIPMGARDNPFFLSLADFQVEPFGDFPVPAGLKPGNLREQIVTSPELAERLDSNSDKRYDDSIGRAVASLPGAIHGIRAVYRVAAYILDRADEQDPSETTKANTLFYKRLLKYGFAASSHTAKDFDARIQAINEAAEGSVSKGEEWIKDLLRFRGFARARSHQAEAFKCKALGLAYPEVETRAKGHFRNFNVYTFPGLTILKPVLAFECWALTSKDVERVERIVRGVLVSRTYGFFYGSLVGGQRRRLLAAIEKMCALMKKVMVDVTKGRENEVCRAFDVGYHLYIAKYVAKDDPRALREQEKKFREEELYRIMDYNELHRCVSGLPLKEAMEVLQMYKALPQPDFDYFGAAHRQDEMYRENREEADKNNAAIGAVFDEIMMYHRLVMVRAFFKRHSRCPGIIRDGVLQKHWHGVYPHIDPRKLIPTDMADIDFHGEFVWKERGTDVLDLVKDKAIIPKNIARIQNGVDVRKTPVTDKNYLMDVLTRDIPIDARTFTTKITTGRMNFDVRADDKAEAKKPMQRLFFELGTEARMFLSIYEDSITDYAIHTIGCFSGKTLSEKLDSMNNITRPISDVLPFRSLHISFDIKKFSPYLPDRVHRALDDQWAEAFGVPELREMHRIITEGNIHYVHGPIHHQFAKRGADFEGFFGKKLTIYHCAVMGYAVRKLRLQKVVIGAGRFAALIDDGLLRVDVEKANYLLYRRTIINEVESVYAHAALRISWDKTYVSEYYATFLHEVRMAGRSITAGLRAALKMTSKADEPVDSLPADLSACASTAFGAIAAGATPVAVYAIYMLNVTVALRRWNKTEDYFKERKAFMLFLPYQHGGCALESIITLSGSLAGPRLVEQMGIIEMIGYRFPEIRLAVNKLLSAKMKPASKMTKLYNPSNMIIHGRRLRSDRFSIMLERCIANRINSPVMKALLGSKSSDEVGFVELALSEGAFIPVPLREVIRDSERYEVVKKLSKKFLTARSALVYLRGRDLVRVAIKNRTEAETVLKTYM